MISKSSKFNIIDELKDKYSLILLCSLAGVSRSGYYKWKTNSKKISKCKIYDLILKIYESSKKVYGYRRIAIALKRKYGLIVNNKKVLRIMRLLKI